MRLIPFSTHPRIINKPEWRSEYTTSWQRRDGTISDLRAHIAAGGAFIPSAMNSPDRTSDAFLYSELAVVDVDHGLSLEGFRLHPLSAYANFLYTTSSHQDAPGQHRFRVVFLLPSRISDGDTYKALITLLIQALGGDKSCSDPCRIFYGCSHGQQINLNPDNITLRSSWLEDAKRYAEQTRQRFENANKDYDDITIARAAYVLEHVLEATCDGQRDHFIRVTAAAASAGGSLFPAWSDWASRGHHGSGKNSRQSSERFFRGFSGRSTLGTLFFLAAECNPNWRQSLPEELKATEFTSNLPAIGYSHGDFLGALDDDEDDRASVAAVTLFNADPTSWPAPLPQQEASPPADDDDDDWIEDPGDPPKRQGTSKSKDSSSELTKIERQLLAIYPGLRVNELNLQLEYGPTGNPSLVQDISTSYILVGQRSGEMFPKTTVHDVAQVIGWRNRYNPVTDYLVRCSELEPITYFEEIATTLLGAPCEGPDNPRLPSGQLYADAVMQRFLVGAVARALKPGCTHDWMPILIGPQNVGKSNFLHYLTPPNELNDAYPWASTVQQGISYLKDRPHALHAGWIVILDETERFFQRRYQEELKNLISVSVDRSARKWENERSFPRAFVMAGCSNSKSFMVDASGNRRFMPIVIQGMCPAPENPNIRIVDLDRTKTDRDRIWSAAYRAYMDTTANHLFTSYELWLLREFLASFSVDTPMTDLVRDALEKGPTFLYEGAPAYTIKDLFERLNLEPGDGRSQINIAVTDELRRLGYEATQRRIGGRRVRFWQLSEPQEPLENSLLGWTV
jgi:hypothetical protein